MNFTINGKNHNRNEIIYVRKKQEISKKGKIKEEHPHLKRLEHRVCLLKRK